MTCKFASEPFGMGGISAILMGTGARCRMLASLYSRISVLLGVVLGLVPDGAEGAHVPLLLRHALGHSVGSKLGHGHGLSETNWGLGVGLGSGGGSGLVLKLDGLGGGEDGSGGDEGGEFHLELFIYYKF